ncbi:hypothetical protein U2F26_34710 [Micromonospora sp. 4G57]|uniref:Uncharacterized protein n=1 Tax=Micromonospora sicca TaxID=2202420 RepID=A0ABU5JEL0_9ACTN|nr:MULTISPECIES: hypothetical protein [unclassified Micromonospora]MDZ5445138.1 hypothetical protein [Micromonospora sp. 4G57]MDZ5447796.1 hypothetical protein [Micromonospora sp. 4G57]MDZ5490986.1 hypothetical protein [Micromonospora sp. 4G53]MDZ5494522.1 hypothetical protein [Micromonospora sp. 4G53]
MTMTTAEVPAPVEVDTEEQLRLDLEELHVRAQQAATQLADINRRLALLQDQVRRHQKRH